MIYRVFYALSTSQTVTALFVYIYNKTMFYMGYYIYICILINLLHESFPNMYKFTSIITYKKTSSSRFKRSSSRKNSRRPRVTPMSWRCKASALWQRCRCQSYPVWPYGTIGIGIHLVLFDPMIQQSMAEKLQHTKFSGRFGKRVFFEQRRQRWTPCIWEHRCQAVPWQIWKFRFTGVESPNTQVMSQRMEGKKRKCHRLGN